MLMWIYLAAIAAFIALAPRRRALPSSSI